MSKLGFLLRKKIIFAVLAVLLGVGGYGMAATGKVPLEVYDRVFAALTELNEDSGPLDGIWYISSESSIEETDEGVCGTATGIFFVKGNNIKGSVINEFGDTFQILANIDKGGAVTGGMGMGFENVVDFSGDLMDYEGEANWNDKLGCYGTAKIERVYASGSYEKRFVKSVQGRVFVIRGMQTLQAKPGLSLFPGDVVSVEEDSRVQIDIGNDVIQIPEQTKIKVPNEPVPEETPSVLQRSWNALKILLKGIPYEIKTPTAVAGVRG